jgi:hypothetical protein
VNVIHSIQIHFLDKNNTQKQDKNTTVENKLNFDFEKQKNDLPIKNKSLYVVF